ncbi:hypothetical protein AZE42_13616 [Rhizopogon vesiculosus]|uniref:Uncharacterized protein n=1 Tax=Rhizopogon vesiculosus TaxID=180088 RepID=A0A1J8PNF4_9AGAM|nr:hypothetical protein AZE42_13616 [Rhizopogon vesiculosus]
MRVVSEPLKKAGKEGIEVIALLGPRVGILIMY